MNGLQQRFISMVEYISDAIARIFSPSNDDFPATGAVPYAGDPSNKE